MKTLRSLACACLAAGFILFLNPLQAASGGWVGGLGGPWHEPTNWSNGVVPNDSDGWAIAEVTNGLALITTSTPRVSEAWAGNNGIPGIIVVTNGGVLNVANWLVSGRAGSGFTPMSHLIVHNGTVNKTGDGFLVGDINNCRGTLTIAGTGTVNVNGGWFGVGNGEGGWGWVYMRDDARLLLADGRDFNIGDWGTGRGWLYLQDNARIEVRRFWVGKNDTAGVMIQRGGTVQGFTPTANEWRIGEGNNAYGFYWLAAGTFNNPNNLHIGANGIGLWYQNGGTTTWGSWTAPGRYANGRGVVYLTSGRVSHTGASTRLFAAEQGRGEINVHGDAVVDCNLGLVLAHAYSGATGKGYLNLNGGRVQVPRFERWGDAPGGLAYVSFNGGVVQAKANEGAFFENMTEARVYAGGAVFDTAGFNIGVNQPLLAPSGNGVASIPVLNGGSGYMGPPWVEIVGDGFGATAVALMEDDGTSNGTFRVRSILVTCPGRDYATPPMVNLRGGLPVTPATLDVATLAPNQSGGITKLGNGILTLGGANTFTGPTLVQAGAIRANRESVIAGGASLTVALGATFDLNNYAQTVGSLSGAGQILLGTATLTCGADNTSTVFSGSITGAGGLTKQGTGALLLSGVNSIAGTTRVNAGRLVLTTASTNMGNLRVADDATLGVQVASAGGRLTVANLTLGESVWSTLEVDLGAFGNPTIAPVEVTGALTLNGDVVVNLSAASLAVGQFPIIRYGTKTGVGQFVLASLPPRVIAELVDNVANQSIDVRVTSIEAPKWAGMVPGGAWDVGLTTNWVGASSGTPMVFQNGDGVLFDDSAPGTTTVNLLTNVQPASVILNNSNLTYTLTGSGKITGPAGLTKNNAGAVTLANTGGNDYAGPTVVNDGLLRAGAANVLSSNSPVQVAGGTLDIQNFNQTVPQVTLASGVIAGSGGTLLAGSYQAQSGLISANLAGPGGLTKTSPGQLTLSGNNTYAGATLLTEGALVAAVPNTLSPNSPLQLSGGTLNLLTNHQTAGAVTLTSGTIDGSGMLTAPSFSLVSGTINASLAGPGNVTKSGGGSVTANGALTHAGSTIVNGGTLVLTAPNSYGGNTIVANGGVVVVNSDASLGSGRLELNPGGTLRVTGTNGFVSSRNINFGVAAWNGGTVAVDAGQFALFTGAMTGAGSDTYFFKTGPGVMYYAGNTAFADATHFFVNEGWLVLSNATMSVNRWSGVASAANADAGLAIMGNTRLTVAHDFNIGDVTPSRARFVMMGQDAEVVCNAFDIGKPANCVGVAYQTAGVIRNGANWFGDWRIGGQWGTGDVGAYGFYQLAGGVFSNVVNNWQVGAYAQGVYYQSGGTNYQGGWTAFGRFGGSPSYGYGVGYLTGGKFFHVLPGQRVIVAEQGRGELTLARSAEMDTAAGIWIGLNYGGFAGYGILNLNGGVLSTPSVTMRDVGATSYLNLNGGTLKAKANEPNFIANLSGAYVYAGGAVIDTAGYDVAIPQPLLAPDGQGVVSITLDNPGSAYLGPPIVQIVGDGTGATAVAEIDVAAGTVTNIIVTSPGRGYTVATVTLSGGGGSGATATAVLGDNVSGGLTKLGGGRLALTGANTFTGPVRVSGGTLVHDGRFAGNVTVEAAGALDLGPALEDLEIRGTLNLQGTLFLDINPDQMDSDRIFGPTNVIFNGRLVIRNLGGPLRAGDSFWLFDALAFEGAFTEVVLPALDPGLAWDVAALQVSGILQVVPVITVPPAVSGWTLDRNHNSLTLEFTGQAGQTYWLQSASQLSTNTVWQTISTNTANLDTGRFLHIITNLTEFPQRYFRLVKP
ncbi:MAG: autotransporter-associated beta strand repeat-containing protein [Verrucomicrobiae bacterium]|nr:autotransporter-associated beta strand repeat-containing protein [Verrucomicrobiae bacterium]